LKLATFENNGRHVGAIIGDMILDVTTAQPFLPACIEELLRHGLLPEVQNLVDNAVEIDKQHFRTVLVATLETVGAELLLMLSPFGPL
jgi:hypothetical protein